MTRPNDVTILRFYRDDDPTPSLKVKDLSGLEDALISLVGEVVLNWGIEYRGGQLEIVGPPRTGCLEIVVAPLLLLPDPGQLQVISSAAGDLARQYIHDNSEVVKTFWELVFGGKGVLDIWQMIGKGKKGVPPTTIDPNEPGAARKEAIIRMSAEAARHPQVSSSVRQLIEAARRCDMDRVTIELSGEPEVDIFSKEMRRRRGIVASRSFQPLPAPNSNERITSHIWIHNKTPFNVLFGNEEKPAVIGQVGDTERLIIWLSKHAIPNDGPAEVRGHYVDPDTVEPLDEDAQFLEDVAGVFVVEGVVKVE